MIKKAFIFFAILFAIYNVVVVAIRPKDMVMDFWQENQVAAQNYIYSNHDSIENVIVGSSMAIKILADELPNTYNLAFQGEGSYAGIDIIIRDGRFPRRVLIEMNFLLYILNSDLLQETLFNPFLYYVRCAFPAVRDGKQPLSQTIRAIESGLTGEDSAGKALFDRGVFHAMFRAPGDLEKAYGFRYFVEGTYNIPHNGQVEEAMRLLEEYVGTLQAHGTEVVFIEVPAHPVFCGSEKKQILQDILYKHFPPQQFTYLPIIDCQAYRTYDGIHMDDGDRAMYTRQLRMQLDSLIAIGK